MSACARWLNNPTVNPYTGRRIKAQGPTYNKLLFECTEFDKCAEWRARPLVNPATLRPIKLDGPIYKNLQAKCLQDKSLPRSLPRSLPKKCSSPRRSIPKSLPRSPSDKYNLKRFVKAQCINKMYLRALTELKCGRKRGHWIWYIFPQLADLGVSDNSIFYGISNLDEAVAYLEHPILGKRYIECVTILNENKKGKSITDIFSTDDVKVHSSLTLFYLAANRQKRGEDALLIEEALEKYFDGALDENVTYLV